MKMKHILPGILLLGIIAALSSCSAELRIQRKQYKEQKLPPGQGEPPARFKYPAQPVQKKVPPVRDEHADAVRVPRSAGAEKGAAR